MERHFTPFVHTSLGSGRAHACRSIARGLPLVVVCARSAQAWRRGGAGRLRRGGLGP